MLSMQGYKEFFRGKHITLMGLGVLGRGVGDARFLATCGAQLIVTDLKGEAELEVSLSQLRGYPNITFHLGGHQEADFVDRDLIIKAAGVPFDSPYIALAKKHHIPVRMSADLFAEFSGIPIVGVTGTRGKSTTAHLVAHILHEAGKEVFLGGNVKGVSTLELLGQITDNSIAVLELDSWQLQGFGEAKLSPHVAAFTTFLPDHMNYYHNDMRAYFADKANIFLNQDADDTLVLGPQVAPFITEYGYDKKIAARTVIASEKDLPRGLVLQIPGAHNRYNASIAYAMTQALGIDEESIRIALESFTGVPGRLQFVREVGGVRIYNDTTATVPDATLAGLHALGDEKKKNIVLIMGGSDKGLDMGELVRQAPRYAKKILLLGGSGTERVKADLPGAAVYTTLEAAVADAFAAAAPGDVLLLSPGFASFGMFANEYDRGEQFMHLVSALA